MEAIGLLVYGLPLPNLVSQEAFLNYLLRDDAKKKRNRQTGLHSVTVVEHLRASVSLCKCRGGSACVAYVWGLERMEGWHLTEAIYDDGF